VINYLVCLFNFQLVNLHPLTCQPPSTRQPCQSSPVNLHQLVNLVNLHPLIGQPHQVVNLVNFHPLIGQPHQVVNLVNLHPLTGQPHQLVNLHPLTCQLVNLHPLTFIGKHGNITDIIQSDFAG